MKMRFLVITTILIVLFSGCINSNNKSESVLEQLESMNCSSNSNIGATFDCDYTTMEEAEELLVEILDVKNENIGHIYENYMYNEEFVDFVLKEPRSIDYPFLKLQEKEYVNIVDSEDGNIRLYYWNNYSGGTMFSWCNICQYRTNGNVYAFEGSITDVKYNILGNSNDDDSDDIDDVGCSVLDIKTIYTEDNGPIYLVYIGVRLSSQWMYESIEAIKIEDDRLVSVPIFNKDVCCYEEGSTEQIIDKCHIDYEYVFSDWYFKANNGEGYDWMFMYNDKSRILYVPYIKDGYVLDKYELYQYDGYNMNFIGVDGGFWLHPSLRSFMCLETVFETKKYRIRIDRMFDGTYRYASWSNYSSMDKLPDLVLYNGYYDNTNLRYCFLHNDYAYYVDDDRKLIVTYKGKEILIQERVRNLSR